MSYALIFPVSTRKPAAITHLLEKRTHVSYRLEQGNSDKWPIGSDERQFKPFMSWLYAQTKRRSAISMVAARNKTWPFGNGCRSAFSYIGCSFEQTGVAMRTFGVIRREEALGTSAFGVSLSELFTSLAMRRL